MIELRHVTKIYPGDTVALDDVDISIGKGEFVFVLGHSGAGKSTLLELLLREELPTSGKITVAGYNLVKMRKKKIPSFALMRYPSHWTGFSTGMSAFAIASFSLSASTLPVR